MSAEEILKVSEAAALKENQIIANVNGKKQVKKVGKKTGLGAAAFITAMLLVFLFFFSSGNIIPSAISERLIEETDVQYADAVASKMLVFQQALQAGDIPDNTATILKENGVLVGYLQNGEFVENNKSGMSSVLLFDGEIITASDFVTKVNSDARLYDAFTKATYSRAAYYYDDSAQEVFKRIGTNRNNYTADSDFDEVMSSLVGEGSNINVNNVTLVEKEDENGEKYYEYELVGTNASSSSDAVALIESVSTKNTATSSVEATMNAADELNTADAISKKQRSELLFVAFMENISKMKAGEGSESKINEAMNYLYRESETSVVDTRTGEVITVKGSMVESPSLYAILSGEKISVEAVENYSSDRILKTIENQLGLTEASEATLDGTVASSDSGVKGSIGRFISSGGEAADTSALSTVAYTIDSSLINNSFETIDGIKGGEMLVEGAVNVGAELAKASGATVGDAEAVKSYARLTTSVLALDAEADRLNRSPFDIASRNTFLGSIVYNIAINIQTNSLFQQFSSIFRVVGYTVGEILPTASAEDGTERYLANFGDCERIESIGAVGSATCSQIATFDTSTLNNTFSDAGFIAFVEENTTLNENGVRTINKDSALADFIKYSVGGTMITGVIDGGILDSIVNNSSSVPFVSNILSMIKTFLGASESDKKIASGESFVNSSSNSDWETYKYAQRYVSLARATEALRQYADDETAYTYIKFFEGEENPVIAFLEEYYSSSVAAQH